MDASTSASGRRGAGIFDGHASSTGRCSTPQRLAALSAKRIDSSFGSGPVAVCFVQGTVNPQTCPKRWVGFATWCGGGLWCNERSVDAAVTASEADGRCFSLRVDEVGNGLERDMAVPCYGTILPARGHPAVQAVVLQSGGGVATATRRGISAVQPAALSDAWAFNGAYVRDGHWGGKRSIGPSPRRSLAMSVGHPSVVGRPGVAWQTSSR